MKSQWREQQSLLTVGLVVSEFSISTTEEKNKIPTRDFFFKRNKCRFIQFLKAKIFVELVYIFVYYLVEKFLRTIKGKDMVFVGPRTKELTTDEETVEVLEIIENCESFSDLDEEYDPIYVGEY